MKLIGTLGMAVAGVVFATQAMAAIVPSGVALEVIANYEGITSGPIVLSQPAPGSVNHQVFAGPGGTGMYGTTDEASAHARALVPGTVGSYSQACCFSPGFGGGTPASVSAQAKASQVTHWQAQSSSGATSVDIDVLAFIDGSLKTIDFAGASIGDVYSTVSFTMGYDIGAGVQNVFDVSATLDVVSGLAANGDWSSSFVTSAIPGGASAAVNYNNFYANAFSVQVNTPFAWVVEIETTAFITGPYELGSVADFLNTGGVGLSTDDNGATLQNITPNAVVPVPMPLALLGSAVGVLAIIRRKSGRVA